MKFHDELNPKLFNKDNILKSEVFDKLSEISNAFIEFLEIPEDAVKDILLVGSSVNYNYTDFSDIDVHLVIDYDKVHKDCPIVQGYLWAFKTIFNDEHDITIYDIPVELYSEDSKNSRVSNGVYSLKTNEWISEPEKIEVTIDDVAVKKKYEELKETIDKIDDSEKAIKLLKKIYDMRKSGLQEEGEFSIENLVFKMLRNNKDINKLWDLKRKDIDNKLSLTEKFIINEMFDDNELSYYEDYEPIEFEILTQFSIDKCNGVKQYQWDLIPKEQYHNALKMYMRDGKDFKFPGRILQNWLKLIYNNNQLLISFNNLAGHGIWFPYEDVNDIFGTNFSYDSFNEAFDYLDDIGFYDWAVLPDGSDAISDFGVKPISDILQELPEFSTKEEMIIAINRCLDVVHHRGDLASAFIEGGSKSLTQISNENNIKIRKTNERLEKVELKYGNQMIDTVVSFNPSNSELEGLLNKYKALRVLLAKEPGKDEYELVCIPATSGDHGLLANWLLSQEYDIDRNTFYHIVKGTLTPYLTLDSFYIDNDEELKKQLLIELSRITESNSKLEIENLIKAVNILINKLPSNVNSFAVQYAINNLK